MSDDAEGKSLEESNETEALSSGKGMVTREGEGRKMDESKEMSVSVAHRDLIDRIDGALTGPGMGAGLGGAA
jgi:hypothetical protein